MLKNILVFFVRPPVPTNLGGLPSKTRMQKHPGYILLKRMNKIHHITEFFLLTFVWLIHKDEQAIK
jgi:hypothetical protein